MKGNPEDRARLLGRYIVDHRATVRSAAAVSGISKSTVHKDITIRLRSCDPQLYRAVCRILARNKAERHLRGGEATRRKYRDAKR